MNQFSTLIELNQFSINMHELGKVLFKVPKNSVYLCNNNVYEPIQFSNGFHISLTSHDDLLSDIMYQPIRSVLSLLLCLADSLYYFWMNVPSGSLFERNFQRNRRGMQLDVRGRGRRKKPSPTMRQNFSIFYSRSTTTVPVIFNIISDMLVDPWAYSEAVTGLAMGDRHPRYYHRHFILNQFFSNSRIFSEMRIIHFKNNFSVNFRILKDRFKMLVLAYDYNKEGNQLDFGQCS